MRRGGVGVLEKRDIWKTVGRGRGAGELNGRMIFFWKGSRVPDILFFLDRAHEAGLRWIEVGLPW